jgi:ASC-1-like (ASCH) protein
VKTAHVEVMPDIEDGAEMNRTEKKKHKKYVLNTVKKQSVKEEKIDEVAPPGKKYERMVKHIKKNYPKDKEGIAYATAWKHKNKDK